MTDNTVFSIQYSCLKVKPIQYLSDRKIYIHEAVFSQGMKTENHLLPPRAGTTTAGAAIYFPTFPAPPAPSDTNCNARPRRRQTRPHPPALSPPPHERRMLPQSCPAGRGGRARCGSWHHYCMGFQHTTVAVGRCPSPSQPCIGGACTQTADAAGADTRGLAPSAGGRIISRVAAGVSASTRTSGNRGGSPSHRGGSASNRAICPFPPGAMDTLTKSSTYTTKNGRFVADR